MTRSDRLRLATLKLTDYGLNGLLQVVRKCLWPFSRNTSPRSIAVYRIGNVGDIVCALPAISRLRCTWPEARIVLVTSPGGANAVGAKELLADVDWIDDIISYDSRQAKNPRSILTIIRSLRERRFDLWIELSSGPAKFHHLVRNMFFAFLVGARDGVGWTLSTIRLWPQLQSNEREFPSEVSRLLRVVDELVRSECRGVEFGLSRNGIRSEMGQELLRSVGLDTSEPYVVFAPGAKREANRWPGERFVGVGCVLVRRGYRVLVVGGTSDALLGEEIAQGIGRYAHNIAGRTDIATLVELVRNSVLAVCVDSGVQHIASAVGVRCVSIFSAREFRGKWYPYGDNVVLEKRPGCHTCLLNICPRGNFCMTEVTEEEVLNGVFTQLDKRGDRYGTSIVLDRSVS